MTNTRFIGILASLTLWILSPVSVQGALTLSLQETSGADLGNLSIGQTLSVDVVLSELQAGEELGYLNDSFSTKQAKSCG
jgi:hypothetical protein